MTKASQAVVVELYGENGSGRQRWFTCNTAASNAIIKGDILYLSGDPRVASFAQTATSTSSFAGILTGVPVGIASMDTLQPDGTVSNKVSVWTDGIFDICASLSINLGQKVTMYGDNYVGWYPLESSGAFGFSSLAILFGTCYETAAAGEKVQVRVNL